MIKLPNSPLRIGLQTAEDDRDREKDYKYYSEKIIKEASWNLV